jgi:hypothetical protein
MTTLNRTPSPVFAGGEAAGGLTLELNASTQGQAAGLPCRQGGLAAR